MFFKNEVVEFFFFDLTHKFIDDIIKTHVAMFIKDKFFIGLGSYIDCFIIHSHRNYYSYNNYLYFSLCSIRNAVFSSFGNLCMGFFYQKILLF